MSRSYSCPTEKILTPSRRKSAMKSSKFLKENETDFIRFKTQLLLAEANNDPVRKADLIRDVVKSIAVIPEAITRTVYIKECSTVLEVSEPYTLP